MKGIKIFIILTLTIINLTFVKSVIVSSNNENIQRKIVDSFMSASKKQLFKVYHFLYKKQYDLQSEEALKRYRIFKDNLKFHKETNEKNLGYTLGIGPFTDLTNEEFAEIYLNKNYMKGKSIENMGIPESEYVRSVSPINHIKHMNDPEEQGLCGACWAFGSLGTLEGNIHKQCGIKVTLSKQQLVDCDLKDHGCAGGYENNAYDYILNNGITTQDKYAYKSGVTRDRGTCIDKTVKTMGVIEGFEKCPWGGCQNFYFFKLLADGPLSVGVDAEGNGIFKEYRGGIIYQNDIDPITNEKLLCKKSNHAVTLIGVDTDPESKIEYLIVRNSWSTAWGEQGYFRIKRRPEDASCFIEKEAFLPFIIEGCPFAKPPKPICAKIFSSCTMNISKEVCNSNMNFNGPIKGIQLGDFKSIILFKEPRCRGQFDSISNGERCYKNSPLSHIISGTKSYILIDKEPNPNCIMIYDLECLSGMRMEICGDVNDLSQLRFNNLISSIRLGSNIKSITVFADAQYKGANFESSTDRYYLNSETLNNDIESIKLILK